jgi:NAD+-processing family protein with receiver domain
MKVFLDDYRQPCDCTSYMYQRIGKENPIYLEEWKVVKDYDEFVKVVKENADNITHISFDHDLADEHYHRGEPERGYEEKTGYDCAVWLKNYYKEIDTDLPVMYVHSMNPVGCKNIINVFK